MTGSPFVRPGLTAGAPAPCLKPLAARGAGSDAGGAAVLAAPRSRVIGGVIPFWGLRHRGVVHGASTATVGVVSAGASGLVWAGNGTLIVERRRQLAGGASILGLETATVHPYSVPK